MQETHDILGIERAISKAKEEVESYTPTPDEFQLWNNHPITQRLKKEIAAEYYQARMNGIQKPIFDYELFLSYGVEGKTND
jgi:hypothetical protein